MGCDLSHQQRTDRLLRFFVVKPGPKFSTEDVANGWIKALRHLGHDVYDWDLGQRLQFFQDGFEALRPTPPDGERQYSLQDVAINATAMLQGAIWEYDPDVILIMTGLYSPPSFYEIARRNGHKTVLFVTESPYEDDRQIPQSRFVDMVVINDTKNLDLFAEQTKAVYYGHGFDPDIHKPGLPDPDLISEFCFVGHCFPERVEFFEQVDWHDINASFAGNWIGTKTDSVIRDMLIHPVTDCILNPDAVRLYQSSLISANIYRRQNTFEYDGHSCGPREIELAATGIFFLRESRPESDALFPMLPTFDSPKDFETKLRWWLAHPDERQKAADEAREAVQHRNFTVLAEQFLSDLETL